MILESNKEAELRQTQKTQCSGNEAAWIKSLVEAARLSTSTGEESAVAGISGCTYHVGGSHTLLPLSIECEILKIGPLAFVPDRHGSAGIWVLKVAVFFRDYMTDTSESLGILGTLPSVKAAERGEHIVFDVQKFAKEAAQQSEEPAVAKAALEISEKAQKVTSVVKAATSSEHEETETDEEELKNSKEGGEETDAEENNIDEEDALGPEEPDSS
ncbi:hypothetical protein, conserved [Eimeria praecox]|uniref:Uncharacterized protein n=1 Tax=Eimeria praecox TaxID=51316 RepID=U6G7N4_9EIME|nr:hypothetical protein, conserved [Eimeria praecox]